MTNKKPLVSVIVPAYNHEKFVSECIESILNQTYENIELIILNDGSKDDTAKLIRNYEIKCKKRFNRFVFIDKENEGICKTLNTGIKESKGEYICLLASDDIMDKNALSQLIEYFNKNKEVERVISNFYIYYYDLCKKEINYEKMPKWVDYMNIDTNKLLKENIMQNNITAFGMYKRIVFDKIGFFDENLLFEDWDINLRVINNNIKLGYLSAPLFYYRKHLTNTSTSYENYKFMLKGYIQIIDKIDKDKQINLKNKKFIIKRARSNKYISIAMFLKENKDSNYKMYIRKSIMEFPFNLSVYKALIIIIIKNFIC